jgi:hypothetical protein
VFASIRELVAETEEPLTEVLGARRTSMLRDDLEAVRAALSTEGTRARGATGTRPS